MRKVVKVKGEECLLYVSELITVKLERMYPDVVLPTYKYGSDSGMDIRAFFHDDWIKHRYDRLDDLKINLNVGMDYFRKCYIQGGERAVIPTGIKVAIPNGFEIQVRPRSGMASKLGITVLNTPGTIDAGYRGEIGIIVYNSNSNLATTDSGVVINHGDRIAQLVLQRVPKIVWNVVDYVDDSARGEDGFGSSGVD